MKDNKKSKKTKEKECVAILRYINHLANLTEKERTEELKKVLHCEVSHG